MQPGARIAQKYRILRALGEGAMGSVWAAENELTQRQFAIKLIHGSHAMADELRHRMLREARACGRLRHKNVVEVYDVGETESGDPFLVMELLEGETLEQLLAQRERLSSVQVAAIGFQVASALAVAHEAGIIHRDLKPANIFLHRDPDLGNVVKVLDFGVSKLVADRNTTTTTGGAVGSPAYMSPEQATARPDVDHRADLWSLGVLLFEAASGQPAFAGDTAYAVVGNILHGPLPDLAAVAPDVDPRLCAIVAACLVREPGGRMPSARQLAAELEQLLPKSAVAVLRDLDEDPTLTAEGGRTALASADRVSAPAAPVAQSSPDPPAAAPSKSWLPLAAGVAVGAAVFVLLLFFALVGQREPATATTAGEAPAIVPASSVPAAGDPTVVPAPAARPSGSSVAELPAASAPPSRPSKPPTSRRPRAPVCPQDKIYFGTDGKPRCAIAGRRLP